MTEQASASRARTGARWIRAALQVNPYGYVGANAPSKKFTDEAAYNAALVAACQSEGIELIAVTDHWCIDRAAGLIADGTVAGLVVLPGFEACTAEGIHLLVIFEAGTDAADINAAIGGCGDAVTPGCQNGTTGAPYADILARMSKRGALVVPAHANVDRTGLLGSRSGQPLVAAVTHPLLHTIGISPGLPEARDQQAVLTNAAPFTRQHPLAAIYADDVCDPAALGHVGGTTYFKVSRPCLESVKLAVRTPATRVALADPEATPRALIRRLSWVGGFLDGVDIDFADDLTALIGGRGTGKSTVIESLRYGLDVPAIGTDASKDHKGIIDKVLRSGTTVTIEVETVTPQPASYTIERSVPNPPTVRDAAGMATRLKPADVIPAIEIFGQHELAELAQNKPSVAQMVERLAGSAAPAAAFETVLTQLRENRDKLAAVEARQARLETQLDGIPRLEDQIKRFEETELETRLARHTRLVQDEVVFDEGDERITEAGDLLAELAEPDIADRLRSPIAQIAGTSDETHLQRVQLALTTLADALDSAQKTMQTAVETAATEVAAARADWTAATQERRDGHAQLLRDLRSEGLEPDTFIATKTGLERLKGKLQQRQPLATQRAGLLRDRETMLAELARAEAAESRSLNASIRTANKATNGTVLVKPIPSPDRGHLHALVERRVRSQRARLLEAVDADDFSPPRLRCGGPAGYRRARAPLRAPGRAAHQRHKRR